MERMEDIVYAPVTDVPVNYGANWGGEDVRIYR